MRRKLVRDESGMTMGLVVIVMVLIGVMGAGLLTFVQRDLNSVVETNRGQKALDIADAGVQVAKVHLRQDSFRQHYDMAGSNDCDEGIRVGSENWSPSTQVWSSDNSKCTGTLTTRPADQVGVTRNFADGKFRVTIQCMKQSNDAIGSAAPCNGVSENAPEATVQAKDRKFFKITSTGYDNTSGNGAVRKVEAIYYTGKIGSVPTSYFTPKNINFNGGSELRRLSFFAGGNITGTTQGSIKVDRTAEALYKDWNVPPYNTAPRKSAAGTSINGVGFGALGLVCGGSTCDSDSNSVADGRNDYDRTTATKGQNRKFVFKKDASGQPAPERALANNEISFPFDPGTAILNPASVVSASFLDELKKVATTQGNYSAPASSQTITTWPGKGAIVFVDGQDVTLAVTSTPQASGILIVRNGNFTLSNSGNGFKGIIIVIGNGTTTGNYKTVGSTALDGFAVASGNLTFGGNVTPDTSTDYSNLLNLYNVNLWSWRELYQ